MLVWRLPNCMLKTSCRLKKNEQAHCCQLKVYIFYPWPTPHSFPVAVRSHWPGCPNPPSFLLYFTTAYMPERFAADHSYRQPTNNQSNQLLVLHPNRKLVIISPLRTKGDILFQSDFFFRFCFFRFRFFCFFSAKLVRTITFLFFQIGQLYLVCGCMTIRWCVAYHNDLRGTLTSRSNNCFLNSIIQLIMCNLLLYRWPH